MRIGDLEHVSSSDGIDVYREVKALWSYSFLYVEVDKLLDDDGTDIYVHVHHTIEGVIVRFKVRRNRRMVKRFSPIALRREIAQRITDIPEAA